MAKIISTTTGLAIFAQSLLISSYSRAAEISSIPPGFTIENADACIAKLPMTKEHFGDYDKAEVNGIICNKNTRLKQCSVESDIPGDNNDTDILIIDENISFQFKDTFRHLVTVNANNQGVINEVSIINGPHDALLFQSESLNLDNINQLAPVDRETIKTWLGYGQSACSPKIS